MEKQIETILKDLYNIDESLRKREPELIKIIKELLESKPDAKLDEQFIRTLRVEILERAEKLKQNAKRSTSFFADFFSAHKMAYAMGGAVITLLLVIPIINHFDKPGLLAIKEKNRQDQAMDTSDRIAKLGNNAFGVLSGGDLVQEESAEEKGAGGGGSMATASLMEGTAVNNRTGLIASDIVNYNYVYRGEVLSATSEQMAVYKKIKSKDIGKDLFTNLSKFDFELVDLNEFKNTSVANINLVEDREFGYSIQLDLFNSSLSINANWEKWPRPEAECRDQACYNKYRLKIGDVPADDKIIAIADKFLSTYNINMSDYGPGEVNDYWRQNYEIVADKTTAYIPDTIQIIYPLIINNKKLYNKGGSVSGITVSVNIRHNKVNSLYNFMSLNFTSSNYEAETNADNIIALAEKGGLRRIYVHSDSTKTIDIELGTPTIELIRYYRYDQGGGTELYVPAYIFPVLNIPSEQRYYQKNIVVPAIKEMLEERINDSDSPMPRPMPLLERGGISTEEAEIEIEAEIEK